jgi:hypothetical protein
VGEVNVDWRSQDGCVDQPEPSDDLTIADADAMDAVLSLLPDARLAAVAVARIASRSGTYPIRTAADFAAAVGGSSLVAYLSSGDLPVEGPIDLAGAILAARRRCRQHQHLRESLEEFERDLHDRT